MKYDINETTEKSRLLDWLAEGWEFVCVYQIPSTQRCGVGRDTTESVTWTNRFIVRRPASLAQ